MKIIGLQRGIVRLHSHHPDWKNIFIKEKRLIDHAVGDFVLDIQHIGSTSIPGILAKPIIDIGIAVNDFDGAMVCVEPLENIGYWYRGEHGVPGRRYFTKGTEIITDFHLHMHEIESKDWDEHIAFRDYLIEHQEKAMEYSELKKRLAMEYEKDREKYLSEKSKFIKKILEIIENQAKSP